MKRSPFLITNDVLIDLENRAKDGAVSELITTYREARERVAYLEDMLFDEISYFITN